MNKVSIIIPSYNQGAFLERSILSALSQTGPFTTEIIVSDGGSKDESRQILDKYSDRIIGWSERDDGFVDAVNKGFKKATGDYLLILNSDDFLLENGLAKLFEAIEGNAEVSFVTGGRIYVDAAMEFKRIHFPPKQFFSNTDVYEATPCQEATLVRASIVEKVGGCDPRLDNIADLDLWFRCSWFGPGISLNTLISGYTIHGSQRTVTERSLFQDACERAAGIYATHEMIPAYLKAEPEAISIAVNRKALGYRSRVDRKVKQLDLFSRFNGLLNETLGSYSVDKLIKHLRFRKVISSQNQKAREALNQSLKNIGK